MNDLICRLRENQYNNLEDILLEASDRTSGDVSELFKLCSQLLPESIEAAKAEAVDSVEESSDRYDEGRDEGLEDGFEDGILKAAEYIRDEIDELGTSNPDLTHALIELKFDIERLRP